MILEDEYFKIERLFMEWFGTSYLENNDILYSSKDIDVIQHTVIPTIYKIFKKISATYNDLIELCTNSEKNKKPYQKREEIETIYKEQLSFLIYITRFFLLMLLEINGNLSIEDCYDESNISIMNFPIKVFHELLGSPGTKENIVFLIDLAFIQGNKLLIDQLYDYLTVFPKSIQYRCYELRKNMKESIYPLINHQLLALTNNFDHSKYFPDFSNNVEYVAIILFKIRNLTRNLWATNKSYGDLIVWWQNFNPEFFKAIKKIDMAVLYGQLNTRNISNLSFLNLFDSTEYWELSTLCNQTALVLYLTYLSALQKDEKTIETITLLQIQNDAYSVNEMIHQAIKFSLISIILDPANYKTSWILSLLHLCNPNKISLYYVYKFTTMTLSLNPCFSDSWILYSLLYTCKYNIELFRTEEFTSEIEMENMLFQEKAMDKNFKSILTKLIFLNSNDDYLRIPLKLIYLGHNIYQILRDKRINDDLCYSVISEMNELNQWITLEVETTKVKNSQVDKSVSISTIRNKKNRENMTFREEYVGRNKRRYDCLPLIMNPIIFKTQMIVWNFKLKFHLNENLHFCRKLIDSHINDILQLYNNYIEKEHNVLDELNIYNYTRNIIERYLKSFSNIFEEFKDEEIKNSIEKQILINDDTQSTFQIDILDWKLLLTPTNLLY